MSDIVQFGVRMGRKSAVMELRLDPAELAGLGELAMRLGFNRLAQEAIDAAYESANGTANFDAEHLLARIDELLSIAQVATSVQRKPVVFTH